MAEEVTPAAEPPVSQCQPLVLGDVEHDVMIAQAHPQNAVTQYVEKECPVSSFSSVPNLARDILNAAILDADIDEGQTQPYPNDDILSLDRALNMVPSALEVAQIWEQTCPLGAQDPMALMTPCENDPLS